MKKILFLFLFVTALGFSQELEWDKSKSFDVVFDIDNVYNSDEIKLLKDEISEIKSLLHQLINK